MPLYEYKCPNCGEAFEKWGVLMRDSAAKQPCPQCAALSERVWSAGQLVIIS